MSSKGAKSFKAWYQDPLSPISPPMVSSLPLFRATARVRNSAASQRKHSWISYRTHRWRFGDVTTAQCLSGPSTSPSIPKPTRKGALLASTSYFPTTNSSHSFTTRSSLWSLVERPLAFIYSSKTTVNCRSTKWFNAGTTGDLGEAILSPWRRGRFMKLSTYLNATFH